jgi:multidrug efflux pump subunit AcrB
VAVVVMTFRSFRLAGVGIVRAGLSAGVSMLALAIFVHPFGIQAIVGLIGSIGVGPDAALVIMTAPQEDEAAATGDPDAMAGGGDGLLAPHRLDHDHHRGGVLTLILTGGGVRPPLAMAVAGGVLLSTIVGFCFALRLPARGHAPGPGGATGPLRRGLTGGAGGLPCAGPPM